MRAMAVFALLTGLVVFLAFWYYRTALRMEHQETFRHLASVAELKVSELENWRRERLGDAEILRTNSTLRALLQRMMAGSESDARTVREWTRSIRAAYAHNRVAILDTTGHLLLSEPESGTPLSSLVIERVRQCVRSKAVLFQDFYRSESDGRVYLALLIPVQGSNSEAEPVAVIVLWIDPAEYLYPMIRQWPAPSESAETLIIRREGNDAVFLNELRFRSNTALSLRMPVSLPNVPASCAARGLVGEIEGVDYRGVPVLAALRPIANSPWFLVARMDITEVEAPVHSQMWIVVLLAASMILAMGIGTRYFWRRRQWEYTRDRLASTELLRESERRFSTSFHTSLAGMSIITRDGILVEANDAFVSLVGKTQDEIRGTAFQDLGLRIPGVDAPTPFDRLRQDGGVTKVQGLITRRDGSTRDVIWNSETVRVFGEKHYLGMMLDVTEQVRLERERELYHRRTRLLLDLHQHAGESPDAILDFSLQASLETTESAFSWIGTLDSEESILTIHKWSSTVMSECAVQEVPIVFPLTKAGYWGECVRQRRTVMVNRYEDDHPAKKGIPFGHVPIERFLGVPIFDQGRIVLLALVANKGVNYSEDDAIALTSLMSKTWEILRRKQVEQDVHDAREQFELFMHHFPGAAFIKDESLRTVFVNRYMIEMLDAGNWVGKGPRDFFPPDIASLLEAADLDALTKGTLVYEESFPTMDGRIRDYETIKFRIRRGEKAPLLGGIATDITARKDAETTLARFNHQLAVQSQIDRNILAAESQEQLLSSVLPLVRDLMGCEHVSIYLHHDTETDVFQLATMVEETTVSRMTYAPPPSLVERLRDGEVIHIVNTLPPAILEEVRDCPLTSEFTSHMHVPITANEELLGILNLGTQDEGYFSEERKSGALDVASQLAVALRQMRMAEQIQRHASELEDRVRARTAELEAANAELEAFAYSVSHDLRSPLRAISGFVNILQNEHLKDLDPEGMRLLTVITSNTQRMDQLISDLLTLSQVTRGELRREVVDMRALILASFDESAPDDILATFQLKLGDLPSCQGDEDLLRQVWQNLIANAIKFSMTSAHRHIRIFGSLRDTEVEYCISDQGVGFNQKYVHKLFGVFNRLHSMHEFPGTGVGLATVHRIVQRHGGRIWAEGKEGNGATFTFTIPIQGARS